MRRLREGRRRSRELREDGQSRRGRLAGVARGAPHRDVPTDQPACLVCDDGLVAGPRAEQRG